MREFTILIPDADDLPTVVGRSLSNMGSLAANLCSWATLLKSLGFHEGLRFYHSVGFLDVTTAAERLIENARFAQHSVPTDISDRAGVTLISGGVQFLTPRGVLVTICRREAGCEVHVNFGRDSVQLATNLLATFFRFGVPGAARLLTQAAAEAAEREEATTLVA
ncbi:MAG: hypothetical protein KBC95_04610 [Candidatus Peribacteraceae bacterium]|nr:hypothetical protein [Candidatus Peribacteraceae bacterium]